MTSELETNIVAVERIKEYSETASEVCYVSLTSDLTVMLCESCDDSIDWFIDWLIDLLIDWLIVSQKSNARFLSFVSQLEQFKKLLKTHLFKILFAHRDSY